MNVSLLSLQEILSSEAVPLRQLQACQSGYIMLHSWWYERALDFKTDESQMMKPPMISEWVQSTEI